MKRPPFRASHLNCQAELSFSFSVLSVLSGFHLPCTAVLSLNPRHPRNPREVDQSILYRQSSQVSKPGMRVYTAQSTEAMKGSNAIFHGPEDWYVSDNELNVPGSGSFKYKDERWSS